MKTVGSPGSASFARAVAQRQISGLVQSQPASPALAQLASPEAAAPESPSLDDRVANLEQVVGHHLAHHAPPPNSAEHFDLPNNPES